MRACATSGPLIIINSAGECLEATRTPNEWGCRKVLFVACSAGSRQTWEFSDGQLRGDNGKNGGGRGGRASGTAEWDGRVGRASGTGEERQGDGRVERARREKGTGEWDGRGEKRGRARTKRGQPRREEGPGVEPWLGEKRIGAGSAGGAGGESEKRSGACSPQGSIALGSALSDA